MGDNETDHFFNCCRLHYTLRQSDAPNEKQLNKEGKITCGDKLIKSQHWRKTNERQAIDIKYAAGNFLSYTMRKWRNY